MIVLVACIAIGFAIVAGSNIPEIRYTLMDRHVRPYVGTACYLTCTALGYGAIFWIAAVTLIELASFLSR